MKYLEEGVCVLITQINVDHLQQGLHLLVAHLVVVVLVGPAQVSMDPGNASAQLRK